MSGLLAGPGCGRCAATEQRCAYVGGCCALCTHWSEVDAEAATEQPAVSDLSRSVHGSEDAYWRHRLDRTIPCGPCALAHLRYKGLVA